VTYPETIAYLYDLLPVFQRQGRAAYKKDLTNTHALLEALGNPQQHFRSLHVGGTNGKGSVASLLASVLTEHFSGGVGLYTSPHMLDFTERIRLDGQPVPQEWVVDFVAAHKALIERIQPSFFELTVAMSFTYFGGQQVRMAVVEVGMGGRLDSTNVLKPELAVITNIGWDHMEFLGDTLAKIAGEKAGIIKAQTPVVVGQSLPETRPVFQRAATDVYAPLTFAEHHYHLVRRGADLYHAQFDVFRDEKLDLVQLSCGLTGFYQQANLRTALCALAVWAETQDEDLDELSVRKGCRNVRQNSGLRGRMEVLREQPTLLTDVAHNVEGIAAMLEHIKHLGASKLHLVIGFSVEKDLERILPLFPDTATYYFVRADLPRARDAKELALLARHFNLKGQAYPTVAAGVEAALVAADLTDLVVVSGSVFTVAETLAWAEADASQS